MKKPLFIILAVLLSAVLLFSGFQLWRYFMATAFQYNLFVNADDDAEFDEYVYRCKALSFYNTGVTAANGDKLITLST